MKKLNLFLLLAVISFTAKAQSISGPTSVYEGEKKSYSVLGFDITKPISWSVSNGSASGSGGLSNSITWNMGATSGKISITGYSDLLKIYTTTYLTVQIKKRESPTVGELSISNSGNLVAYAGVQLRLNYLVTDDFWSTMQQTVTWTINGETTTGNPITVSDLKSGSNEISAKLTFYGYSGGFSTTKTIYVTPAAPPLTISGPSHTTIGVPVQYMPIPNFSASNVRYEWEVNMWSSKYYYQGRVLDYSFSVLFTNQVTCKAIDIHSGLYTIVTKDVTVLRPGEDPYRMIILDSSEEKIEGKFNEIDDSINLTILSNSKTITVSKETGFSLLRNQATLSYAISSLTTGIIVSNGIINGNGGIIDLQSLPKGLYVVIITDGSVTKSEKFSVR